MRNRLGAMVLREMRGRVSDPCLCSGFRVLFPCETKLPVDIYTKNN